MSIKHAQNGDNFRSYLDSTNFRKADPPTGVSNDIFKLAIKPTFKKPVQQQGPAGKSANYKRRDPR
jgi:hypothetical protein